MKKINTKIYGSSKFNGALNRIIAKIKAEADKVPAIKEKTDKLVIDSTTGTMTINSGIDVGTQGDVTVGRDLYVEDEIVIDSLAKIVDTDGNQLKVKAGDINSETATNGQVLTANGSGGVSFQDAGGGGLYIHSIYIWNEGFTTEINIKILCKKSTIFDDLSDLLTYYNAGSDTIRILSTGDAKISGATKAPITYATITNTVFTIYTATAYFVKNTSGMFRDQNVSAIK